MAGARTQAALGVNPMVGVIEGFRWAIVVLLAITDVGQFRRMEMRFADVI